MNTLHGRTEWFWIHRGGYRLVAPKTQVEMEEIFMEKNVKRKHDILGFDRLRNENTTSKKVELSQGVAGSFYGIRPTDFAKFCKTYIT